MPEPAEKSTPKPAGGPAVAQWAVLIGMSVVMAAFLLWLHAPAALMLGPLLAAMAFSSLGGKVRFPLSPFVLAQGVVGCLIVKMVPLSIVGDILAHWPLFTLGVLSVVVASSFIGWLMTRIGFLPGTTALWGTSPGAASIMTIMAESYGADVRLVAFMQYFRVVIVAAVAALVARWFGVSAQHTPAGIVWFPPVHWLSFAETMVLAIVGPLVAQRFRIPAGAFLVPMAVGVVLAHFGLLQVELPTWILVASYAFIGWNIGLRFTRPLLIHAMLQLPRILVCVFLMIGLCGCIAMLLVWAAGVDPLTAYLATSPGGVDSVAIIAASSNVDVSFVMAMQTVRLIAVLFLGPALTRFIVQHTGVGGGS
ncbi:MAG: AbrB family transcriptional regulator [Alphaproteobacteria bacterium]|nr:AbrB family transcriptional regulator [Alphaproteobacteria bacterium]